MDVSALAALQSQLRLLTALLDRLDRARCDLVPSAATFWAGPARVTYDRAVLDVDGELGSALELLLLAQQNTVLALAAEAAGG
jgi:hypothetical protein